MDLPIGECVADYQVTGVLGEGGFGTVYSGVHPLIGKKVAIKVLKTGASSDKDTVARFLQEARAVNQIGHSNIIDIFAFGELAGGQQYFIMEWLPGQSLGEKLEQEKCLSLHETAHILSEIAKGLAAAHENGIYHRDLKPANIYLVPTRDGLPRVKILDFGIAKLTDGTAGVQTHTGVAIGSPRYMSPEQWDGEQVDQRTDIYALGILMFQMITGDVPFKGSTSMKLMAQHFTVPVPSASSKGAPRCVDTVIEHALAKEPQDRTPSAAAFQQELSEALRGLPDDVLHDRIVVSNTLPALAKNSDRDRTEGTLPSHGKATAETRKNGPASATEDGVSTSASNQPVAPVTNSEGVADSTELSQSDVRPHPVERKALGTGTIALIAALVVSTATATYLFARGSGSDKESESIAAGDSPMPAVGEAQDAAPAEATDGDMRTKIESKESIVLTDGKEHYFVVDARWMKETLTTGLSKKMDGSDVSGRSQSSDFYFGTFKGMEKISTREAVANVWKREAATAKFWDPYSKTAALAWNGTDWILECTPEAPTPLTLSLATTEDSAHLAQVKRVSETRFSRRPMALLADHESTFFYVDYDLRSSQYDGSFRSGVPPNLRVFVGGIGAMKQVEILRTEADNSALTLVTNKGTLTIQSQAPEHEVFHPGAGKWTPTDTTAGERRLQSEERGTRKFDDLVYRDLGVYLREGFNSPCQIILVSHSQKSSASTVPVVRLSPSEGLLSDVHKKYQGKVVFSKSKVPRAPADDSEFSALFGLHDRVYLRAFLSDSLANILAKKNVEPARQNKILFQWEIQFDSEPEHQWLSFDMWYGGDMNLYFTTAFGAGVFGRTNKNNSGLVEVANLSSVVNQKFIDRIAERLQPGDNHITVHLQAGLGVAKHNPPGPSRQTHITESLASGSLTIRTTANEIREFVDKRGSRLPASRFPKAKKRSLKASLQKVVNLDAGFGGEKFAAVALPEKGWEIDYRQNGSKHGRSTEGILVTKDHNENTCTAFDARFTQQALDGKFYSDTVSYQVRNHRPFPCQNLP